MAENFSNVVCYHPVVTHVDDGWEKSIWFVLGLRVRLPPITTLSVNSKGQASR